MSPSVAGIMAIALTPALQVRQPAPSATACQTPNSITLSSALVDAVCVLPQVAAVVSSTFYSIWNLFSGFLIPQVRELLALHFLADGRFSAAPVASADH